MRTLSPEDMARIVNCGELFLLVDVRPKESTLNAPLPGAVRVPYSGDTFVPDVLSLAGQLELPVVVYGDGEDCPIAHKAADQLKDAGFVEVWAYCGDVRPWAQRKQSGVVARYSVVTDPDVTSRHRRGRVDRAAPYCTEVAAGSPDRRGLPSDAWQQPQNEVSAGRMSVTTHDTPPATVEPLQASQH